MLPRSNCVDNNECHYGSMQMQQGERRGVGEGGGGGGGGGWVSQRLPAHQIQVIGLE